MTNEYISMLIEETTKGSFRYFQSEQDAIRFALQSIDLTTLEGSNTEQKIIDLCQRAAVGYKYPVAAVCVYPVFVRLAKRQLAEVDVKVACVAGAFPAGQSPLNIKLAEVQYAVDEGADEVDTVISRGKFLEGKYEEVANEIFQIKSLCKNTRLKVILETGELISMENIFKAAQIAMESGADFIKTSTGKTAVNATPEAFACMLLAIKDYYEKTGRQVGIKPAGGITDVKTTLLYIKLLESILGKKWLNNSYFRIGASRLADSLNMAI